jgi:sugar/nucleoside kinase (ribokinase family)
MSNKKVIKPGKVAKSVDVVVVGSIGLDTIETPFERHADLLGGSVSYACAAASFFAPVGMVGIVGTDFPEKFMKLYRAFGIELSGLAAVPGKTFRWSGVYDQDMINRRTLATDLNVFETFSPELPEAYREAPFVMLGNISPALQLKVIGQIRRPRFVVADTMDLWIDIARADLMNVIKRVNLLMLNDGEARQLTGLHGLRACAEKILEWGPSHVVIKKGEHGSMLVSRSGVFLLGAYPIHTVKDPTGAGDCFAGGFIGHLAAVGRVSESAVREALLHGSVVASFGVEDFSLARLAGLGRRDIARRVGEFRKMIIV